VEDRVDPIFEKMMVKAWSIRFRFPFITICILFSYVLRNMNRILKGENKIKK
jgi:hypothetical protein